MNTKTKYYPESWVVIKINQTGLYKLLVSTHNGWDMNSGITWVSINDQYISFFGVSGSEYVCKRTGSYYMNEEAQNVYNRLTDAFGDIINLMDEDTVWESIKYTPMEGYDEFKE